MNTCTYNARGLTLCVAISPGIFFFIVIFFPAFNVVCLHRPQDQQQQQFGSAPVRLIGSGVNASSRQRPATVNVGNPNVGIATNNPNIVGNMLPQHVPISYYTQHSAPQTSYFNDVLHPMQVL